MAFIGWFGPRGLASLVFALLALERGVPDGEVALTTVVVTVALSVVVHGLTSVPLIAAYRARLGARGPPAERRPVEEAHAGRTCLPATPTRHRSGLARRASS